MSVIEWATVKEVTMRTSGRAAPERDHEAEQEEQVVGPVQDVGEAEADEAQGGLVPPRVEPDEARVAARTRRRAPPRPAAGSGAR